MPTVRLRFSPSPAHVRTARLVAVACGRRAGVAVERLEELKLAVGEACARAVARHRRSGLSDLVLLELADDAGFEVRVFDYAPAEPQGSVDPEETVAAEAGIALLAESADVLKVIPGPGGLGSQVSLWWPTRSR
ncbi:ATP-binding protein [Longispora albida]|uniref:ATP-binding protein n=1 Tax=Longispora albida TaxID=203523 RepID=UPI0003685A0D|nr:ATP-binding protein [Longispora albida]